MFRLIRKLIKFILSIIGVAIILVGSFLVFATFTTLKVKDVEAMEVKGTNSQNIKINDEIKILSWNIGYGALDETADFYMDGGKQVVAKSKEAVNENLAGIVAKMKEIDPDILFNQELDINSKRSHHINELEYFETNFDDNVYQHSYACNYKAGFVPIPLYQMMGRVEAGITTFSKYSIKESTRIQLPIPFKWPVSLMNLKRCLLVSKIDIDGTDKQLVLINLHLEAYSSEEGKTKQLEQLMNLMQDEYNKGNYVIAGGDFNQTFSTTNYGLYPKLNDWVCPVIDASQYSDFTFRMDDTTPTCRSLYKPYFDSDKENHQYYMIDGFVVSNNVEIKTFETIDLDFKNSDHNPVVMRFKLV